MIRSLSTQQSRSRRFDSAVAGLFLLGGVWSVWVGPPMSDGFTGPRLVETLCVVLLSLPLAWRREHPVASSVVIGVGLVLLAVATGGSSEGFQNFSAYVAAYSAAAYGSPREAVAGLLVAVVALALFGVLQDDVRRGHAAELWSMAFFSVLLLAVWLAGLAAQHIRARRQREAQVEAQRLATDAAVRDERARLAHELHDIVSHNLSVVVLQASGAQAQGSGSSDVLAKIEESGRQALVEMRRLLGILRDGEHTEPDPALGPQPTLQDLDELIAAVRTAGTVVTLTVSGDPASVPQAVQLAVYRVIQESLTNVLKHAPDAETDVAVQIGRDGVVVEVRNTRTDEKLPQTAGRTGYGLVGLRERIELFGGTFTAGVHADGCFSTRATIPLEAAR